MSQGDDHLMLVKQTLKATFPTFLPGGVMFVDSPRDISYVRFRRAHKNCINCGAPPDAMTTVCSYCGTKESQ